MLKYQNNEKEVKSTKKQISEAKMVQSSKISSAIQHKLPQVSTQFGNLVNFSLDRTTLNSIFQSKSKPRFCSILLHDVVHSSDRYSLIQLA